MNRTEPNRTEQNRRHQAERSFGLDSIGSLFSGSRRAGATCSPIRLHLARRYEQACADPAVIARSTEMLFGLQSVVVVARRKVADSRQPTYKAAANMARAILVLGKQDARKWVVIWPETLRNARTDIHVYQGAICSPDDSCKLVVVATTTDHYQAGQRGGRLDLSLQEKSGQLSMSFAALDGRQNQQ